MLSGSIVALITPMHADGTIDYARLESLIGWHLERGTHGIVILGTTGESPTIEDDERAHIIRMTVAIVNKKIPVIVGAGSNATAHAIHWTAEAKALGADAVLLVTPYYNRPTQEGLFQHYGAIAKAVSIPQILYNVPGRTGCDLLPETILRLSQYSNIVAVKEATGDLGRLQKLRSFGLNMTYFTGNDDNACEFMLAGGQGVISVAANVIPALFSEFCTAALSGDRQKAEKMDASFRNLYRALFIETNPIPTKYLLEKMGLISSGIRLPLTRLSYQHQGWAESVLKDIL
jgi:4-hydroxy-tetrahydrodipicolinate synthase